MKIQINHFSKDQTAILKGFGILFIVLHNFFHNLTPALGENEFSFSSEIYRNYYQTFLATPENFLRLVFSYFGHYGVQIFVFFSSYGLTRKYYQKPLIISKFLAGRIDKIYLSFLLCVVVYIALGFVKAEFVPGEKVLYWDSLLWKVLLVSNFIPRQALMPVGPWWFMPFIFQVYLLYPLLLNRYKKLGYKFLILISLAALLLKTLINPGLVANGLNANHTVLGHLPVLCLGLFFAAQDKIEIHIVYVGFALLLFLLANFNVYLWLGSDLAFTIIVIAASATLFRLLSLTDFTARLFIFIGHLSFHLFMVNGFLRTPFHRLAETYNHWWLDNLSAVASLLFSTLCAYSLRTMDNHVRAAFRSKS